MALVHQHVYISNHVGSDWVCGNVIPKGASHVRKLYNAIEFGLICSPETGPEEVRVLWDNLI